TRRSSDLPGNRRLPQTRDINAVHAEYHQWTDILVAEYHYVVPAIEARHVHHSRFYDEGQRPADSRRWKTSKGGSRGAATIRSFPQPLRHQSRRFLWPR